MRCIGRVSAATSAAFITEVQVEEVIEQRDGMAAVHGDTIGIFSKSHREFFGEC